LLLEPLENRNLLAANMASIAGTVFIDATDNGITGDDTGVAGVTVNLYSDGGDGSFGGTGAGSDDTLAGTQPTNGSGNYRFNSLSAGQYFVEQEAATGLLQRAGQSVQSVAVTALDAAGVTGSTIDSYDLTTQSVEASSLGSPFDASAVPAPEVIGGERDMYVELTSGTGRVELMSNTFSPQTLVFAAVSDANGRRLVTWDGPDNDAINLDPTGLGDVDLTEGGASTALRLIMGADHDNGTATLRIYSGAGSFSSASVAIPNTGTGAADVTVTVPFSAFALQAGGGADFEHVGAIQLEIAGVAAVDGEIDDLGLVGPTVLTANFANLQPMSLGDLVWSDTDNDGVRDAGESGISDVTLNLYRDTDSSGGLTAGVDALETSTTTDANGNYGFGDLLPGDYVVQVDTSNFAVGGALAGLVTSTGNDPAPDPDDDVNNDDNGSVLAGQGVVAATVTLAAGNEPINDGDADRNTNLSVDFGFATITDLAIFKSDLPDPVVAGEILTYTLQITNHGPSDATGVTVVDTLPTGVTYRSAVTSQGTVSGSGATVTANLGGLAVSDSATVTIEVDVDPATRGTIVNTATVSGNEIETTTANNVDTEPTVVNPRIDLAIDKADSPDPAVAGGQLTYTLVVTNNGPSDATGVTVIDTLPTGVTFASATTTQGTVSGSGNTVTANLADMAAGAFATITVTVDIAPGTQGRILNTATVSGNETEITTSNNTDTEPTQIDPVIDLAIDKSDSPDPVQAGGQLTYTLDVSNSGPSDATGVTVVDTLPAGVTYRTASTSQGTVSGAGNTVTANLGNMANGGSATVTITVDVDSSTQGTILNTATVSGNETETTTANNTDTEPTVVNPVIDLAIDKSDSPDPVVAGEQLTYTLIVTNNGPSNATGVTVVDTLPSGVSFASATTTRGTVSGAGATVTADIGNLAVSASTTITITVDVDPSTRGTIVNTATVSGNETEITTSNNTDTEPTVVNPVIDLAIDKSDSPDPAIAGGQLTYTLVATNNGPSNATGVTVVDALPSGVTFASAMTTQGTVNGAGTTVTANVGNLAVRASTTITITVDVDPSTRGTIVNTATVSGNETEITTSNNTDAEPTQIQPQVDLAILKTDSPDPVIAGESLTYTLAIVNNGPSDATGVMVVDTLPAGVTYRSASTGQGTVSGAGQTVTANLGDLDVGASITVTVLVDVDPATRGTIVNVANVSGNETEINPNNNVDDEPTVVNPRIDLTVTKSDSADPVTAGDSLTYTLTVTNSGPSDATGVTLVDTLPSEVTFTSASSSQGTVGHSASVVTANLGNLAVGQSATATIVTQVRPETTGTITNQAEVSGNETEITLQNNTALEPTAVDALFSSISGLVYLDLDYDGLMDGGESPISGVTVQLVGVDTLGQPVQLQTTTGNDGAFRFADLRPGTYRLVEDQPTSYRDGLETVGTVAATTNQNDEFADINLGPGVDAVDYLFGEHPAGFSKRRFLTAR